jgi:arsenite methyltransferase
LVHNISSAAGRDTAVREIARVLKPGGRLAVSDIALKRPLPAELAGDLMAYVGCIAGAVLIDEYRRMLVEAGLTHVQVVDSGADRNAYAQVEDQAACCPPTAASPSPGLTVIESPYCAPTASEGTETLHARLADLLRRYDVNDYAASVRIYAVKPRS